MMRRSSILMQSCHVSWSTVPFMLIEAIFRVDSMKLNHQTITRNFGYDRCSCYRETVCIAFDNRALWEGDTGQEQSIKKQSLRRWRKLLQSKAHSIFSCL